ncbi:hypothetical protein [Tortoise microvirus 103]|nr:hypothetical protein [Tortoise microvirus 5]QCS37448.1 hypothetical protein [Tortoise microvirus 103]
MLQHHSHLIKGVFSMRKTITTSISIPKDLKEKWIDKMSISISYFTSCAMKSVLRNPALLETILFQNSLKEF